MKTNAISLAAIRTALEAGEFFVVYQPIVSLVDGSCFGGEALIRWRRADAVTIEPGGFIPLTDHTPLSGAITYWVIDTVAAQLGDWLKGNEGAHISINVPPEILGRGGLEYAATKSGLRARTTQLIIEITEHGIPDQLGLDALNSIPDTGAQVALDDTTLSGANLALLTRCPFSFVKIDRTLVAELAFGKPRPSWLDGLTALSQATALKVIAEGVETPFQLDALREAGVELAQGYYFSAPRDVNGFKRYYAETTGRRRGA
jgi:sensor c-di-GMP phosphodiesterase-like protein